VLFGAGLAALDAGAFAEGALFCSAAGAFAGIALGKEALGFGFWEESCGLLVGWNLKAAISCQ
jgi:hypothetical protein